MRLRQLKEKSVRENGGEDKAFSVLDPASLKTMVNGEVVVVLFERPG